MTEPIKQYLSKLIFHIYEVNFLFYFSYSTSSGEGGKFCGGFAATVEEREEESQFQKEVSFKTKISFKLECENNRK